MLGCESTTGLGYQGDVLVVLRRRRYELLLVLLAVLLAVVLPPAAIAAASTPNGGWPAVNCAGPGPSGVPPVNWTVIHTFKGKQGDDIPLRIGQADYKDKSGSTVDGFGMCHILAGHGSALAPPEGVQYALQEGECDPVPGKPGRIACFFEGILVVYSTTIDPRSGDGRYFGIVTVYYGRPCC
jgi:hypothetical protein